ncbi:hypothetical protein [Nocardia sp. NPDC057227]|uniref:hypothetical protein n=1 Tax=Nocardia sp. NPDC057227 TaxID=3346056 RepID=UPI0036252206
MDEKVFLLLVKVLAGIAIAITAGFLFSFVVMPIVKADYEPPTDLTAVMSAVITALITLLGGAYFKSRRAAKDGEDEPDGGEDAQ